MDDGIRFRRDLYRGTAAYYDKYRLPYPPALIDDLVARTALSGAGRLVDLACGPGLVAFALCSHFAEVWAVDQEADMIFPVGLWVRRQASSNRTCGIAWSDFPRPVSSRRTSPSLTNSPFARDTEASRPRS